MAKANTKGSGGHGRGPAADGGHSTNGEAAGDVEKVLRQNAPAPVCPYCDVPCESNRSDPFFTRYYCPNPDCSYAQKVPRPRMAERVRRAEDDEGFSAR